MKDFVKLPLEEQAKTLLRIEDDSMNLTNAKEVGLDFLEILIKRATMYNENHDYMKLVNGSPKITEEGYGFMNN